MITFASFPVIKPYDAYEMRREVDEEENMDYEYDDDFSGGKLTCPGEVVTSSQAFMRSAILMNLITINI
jgi:hypothetical protein